MRSRAETAERNIRTQSSAIIEAGEKIAQQGLDNKQLTADLHDANVIAEDLTQLLALTGEAHATGPWRIGSVRMDPLAIQARLRRIVPSLTVQEGDNHLYVVYSDEPLEEADFARVKAEFQSLLDMDRT